MLNVADIVPPDGVLLHLTSGTLSGAVLEISAAAAETTGLRAPLIHERLMARAQLGATLGHGVVLPHARLPGLRRVVAFFARPIRPIVVEGGEPITMLFVLLAPEDADAAHLKTLARIAGLLRDETKRTILQTADRDTVFRLLTEV